MCLKHLIRKYNRKKRIKEFYETQGRVVDPGGYYPDSDTTFEKKAEPDPNPTFEKKHPDLTSEKRPDP